jgi:orotidine 5'-phosphate decarboxylase subfamily 2
VTTYLERLAARSAATGTVLCLGLDPDPAALPAAFPRDLGGVEAFAGLVLEASVSRVAAVKPNLAFFEAYGSAGLAALERLRARIPGDVPVIADGKRGDIETTAARQAVALYDALGVDAVTVNPYLGERAIEPLLDRLDRYAYVLCRTSNPGAGELQDLVVAADPSDGAPDEPLHVRVARRVAGWGPGGTVSSWARPRPSACATSGPWRPVSACSCPVSGPRAGPSRRSSPTVPRRRRRRVDGRAVGWSSTCRGASPERAPRGPRRPSPRPSRGPPPTGLNDCLCYPSRPRETPD